MPNKKAFGIQVAKMCEAFVEAGHEVRLLVPRTSAFTTNHSVQEFYHLRTPVPTIALPAFDWYGTNFVGFVVSASSFMITSTLYLWWQWLRGGKGVVYAVDTDTFSYTSLLFTPYQYAVEVDRMPATFLNRLALRGACAIVGINREVRKDLVETEGIPARKVTDSPNGVDPSAFDAPSRVEARRTLTIPEGERVALFAGRFWGYKGVRILYDAALRLTNAQLYIIGGSRDDFMKEIDVSELPSALHIMGECKSFEVPTWLAAADALIVIGSAGNVLSARYFSPMKVYEYMAAHRPIISADVPAIHAVLPEKLGLWYEPDNAVSLAEQIEKAVTGTPEMLAMAELAQEEARNHTWAHRARQIASFMQSRMRV
ncbi:MAG: glycosyltransferase family 4 protein [Minisyncoccia bacterium]|jgi:glycosyltransferase involved in cell wall biosynthesis